jgi:methionyl aminopeptidase
MGIIIKTEEEIKIMREGGKILSAVLDEICKRAKPGVTTYELDKFAEEFIKRHNAIPGFKGFHGFPGNICAGVNEEVVHGIPKRDKYLKEGDLFTVDCGVLYKGFFTDAARSIGIGKVSEEKEKLMKTAKEALSRAINISRPGTKISKLGEVIEETVQKAGFKIIRNLTGHGIGKSLHEDPVILNYKNNETNAVLQEGMTIAIEPIFCTGSGEMKELSDNWTIITSDLSDSVQEENTILITKNKPEILTRPQ